MELRQYWELLKKWLWLILLTTIIAAFAAFIFSSRQTPIYRASARLMLSPSTSKNVAMQYNDILAAQKLGSTYAELLTTYPLIEAAIAKAGLEGVVDPENLMDAITVQAVRNTQLIELHVEYWDPSIAAKLANTIPEVFVEFNTRRQTARYEDVKKSLQEQLQQQSQQIQAIEIKLQQLDGAQNVEDKAQKTILENQLVQYRSTYGNVLAQLEEIRLAEANALDVITVVEPAKIPKHPVRPRVLMNTLMAAIVGGMIGLGAAFLIEYMDDTIKTPDDITRITPLSTLGIIARNKKNNNGELITVTDPRSPVAEAYRTIRTGIQFASVDKPLRTLVVTSAGPSEGKSTTVANLAVVMAQAGKKVIIVDADLRKPTQHKRWKIPNTAGLTGAMLMDELTEDLDYLLNPTEVDNLWVMTSGQLPHNPSELLGSNKLQQVVDKLLETCDIVILDSPPALAVTDPVVLAQKMDGVIIVVDAGATHEPALIHVLSEMEKAQAHIVGLVLNRFKSGSNSGYYYYYYERYYHDEEGVQENGNQERSVRHSSLSATSVSNFK